MTNELVSYESDGRIALITITRPDKRNALNSAAASQLAEAWDRFQHGSDLVAVITGAGSAAFCAGADLEDIPDTWRVLPNAGVPVEKPLIAAVTGWAIGLGAVIVQMCDLCYATASARFWYPEPILGTTSAYIASLSVRVPHKVAMEFMLLCEPMAADRAFQVGLVNEVVPEGEHVERALARARRIAEHGPSALRLIKRQVGACLPKGPTEQAAIVEWELEQVRRSPDRELLAAYNAKRSSANGSS